MEYCRHRVLLWTNAVDESPNHTVSKCGLRLYLCFHDHHMADRLLRQQATEDSSLGSPTMRPDEQMGPGDGFANLPVIGEAAAFGFAYPVAFVAILGRWLLDWCFPNVSHSDDDQSARSA